MTNGEVVPAATVALAYQVAATLKPAGKSTNAGPTGISKNFFTAIVTASVPEACSILAVTLQAAAVARVNLEYPQVVPSANLAQFSLSVAVGNF